MRRKIMLAKVWKKIGFIILIIACLFNITTKLVKKLPFLEELKLSAQYVQREQKEENK